MGSPALPAGTQDPSVYDTPSGALGFAEGTKDLLQDAASSYVVTSALFTDEMTNTSGSDSVNARQLLESSSTSSESGNRTVVDYKNLQKVRGQARVARGAVAKYAPSASPTVRGILYAMEGYVDLLLAEMYCSGVPMSTVDFERDFTYQAGSTNIEIYTDAAALFDSALTLAGDSVPVQTFARVGKGRALLGLGQYAAAAQAVAAVPEGSSFPLHVVLGALSFNAGGRLLDAGDLSDNEGQHGLRYLSDGDPRTRSDTLTYDVGGVPTIRNFPIKYQQPDTTTLIAADWVEARLIQAEAALKSGDVTGWLTQLNHLRSTVMLPDGTVNTLPQLHDPGTDAARVDTLFAERAKWMYLTGHRQGDLRRLVRQYGRTQSTVYPNGAIPGFGFYGTNVNAPVPVTERINPLFHGCFDRAA